MSIAPARQPAARRGAAALATGLVALVVLAGCGSTGRTAASPGTTAPTSAASAPASPAAGSGGTSTSGSSPSKSSGSSPISAPATDPAPSGYANLYASPELKQQLAQALVTGIPGLQASDVDGTEPGTVFYAQDNQTGEQYAVASIAPSATLQPGPAASPQGFSQFNPYPFTRSPGGTWKLGTGGLDYMGTHCPADVPDAVLRVWGQTPGACDFPSGS